MKVFFFYLVARLKFKPISWTQAKADASRVDVVAEVEAVLDNACLRVESAYNFLKILFTASTLKLDTWFQKAHKKITQYFVGRLFICAARNQMDYQFLFKGGTV